MKGSEFKKIRLDAYMTQYDMAQKVGVTVDTIRRWEHLGERELPFLAVRKINAGKVKSRFPDLLLPVEAGKLRPDLNLFGQPYKGAYPFGPEHPKILLPHLADGPTLPWSILESPEYLEALEAHRAKPQQPDARSRLLAEHPGIFGADPDWMPEDQK